VLYGLLFSAAGRMASVRSIVSTGATLMAVGIGLKCWNAWQTGQRVNERLWLAATAAFPVVSVIVQGFLGYGFAAMMVVLAFRSSFHRPKWRHLVYGVVLAFVGLSVYVTYMRDRDDIRSLVWCGGALAERASQLQNTVAATEWFDPTNIEHLRRIDLRLNQNYLVGAAVVRLRERSVPYADGATLAEAGLAMIPRALWPDKPVVAGSGDLVSIYTGMWFDQNTSVGVGQVMEYYINFGTVGVVLGFLIMGMLLVTADRSASDHLNRGDSRKFMLWYLPALSFLQVGGSFTEASAGAAAALVLSLGINWTADHVWRSQGPAGSMLEPAIRHHTPR
jgi:phosphate starvation-inducible membrane PsiE